MVPHKSSFDCIVVQSDPCNTADEATQEDILVATLEDADALYGVINSAYSVEVGDSGVAFKKLNRLLEL
jgi:hypothetical protein